MTDNERSERPRTWRRFAYPVFIVLFAITAVELAGRWYLTQVLDKATEKKFRFNSYRVYEHVPGYREGPQADGTYRLTINAEGFRRRSDVGKEKPAGVYRIFLMGGSAAHGVSSAPPFPVQHLDDTRTIDAVLERLLNEHARGQRVEVINAAVTGYQLFQHTAYLQSEVLDHHPDLVIFFDGANDHYTDNVDMRYMQDYRFQFWKERLQEPSFGGALSYVSNWLAEYSAAFKAYVAWALQRDALQHFEKVDLFADLPSDSTRIAAHKAIAPGQFLRSMHMNLDLLHREGVDAILCLQPMLVLRDRSAWSPEERALIQRAGGDTALYMVPAQAAAVTTLYPTVAAEVAAVAREHKVPFIDLNAVFATPGLSRRTLFMDDCHLTADGAAVCAGALLSAIEANIAAFRPAVTDSAWTEVLR